MLNRLPFLLLAPFLVFSSEISKTYLFPAPAIRDGRIIMKECFTAESRFAPGVAARSIALMIPVGHKVVSCRVNYGHPAILIGTHDIKPAIPSTPKSHGPFPLSKKAMASVHYVKNAFYPEVASGALNYTIQYKNGVPILNAIINPSEYNPVTRLVRYYENVSVTVETAPTTAMADAFVTQSTISEIRSLVENPEIASSLPLSTATTDDYEYLILCKTIFAGLFNDLIAFNTRRGLRTKVFTLDQIKTAVPAGTDIPERVRTFIKRHYDSYHIRFVLIASNDPMNDPTAIPHRGFWAKYYDHDVTPATLAEDTNIPADMYYGCLTGDWKTDATGAVKNYGYYGTEDIPAEVFVGRFCVSTAVQLKNMIGKTIKYSEQPVTGTNNCMLAGEFLWDDDGVVCTGSKTLANLKGEATTGLAGFNNFTTYAFPSSRWTFTEVSHEQTPDWCAGDYSFRDSLFYTGVSRNKCAWVNHNGHSTTEYAIGAVSTAASRFYSNGQNPVLSDNTWKNSDGVLSNYFFLTSGGCYNASFDNFCPPGSGVVYSPEDCWMAVATRVATGPVAAIGNSRFGLGDNDGTDGGSDRPMRFFHDAIFNPTKRFHYAGMMLAKAKETDAARITLAAIPTKDITLDVPYYGALKYTNYELNLLGDPALSLWTAAPQKLVLQPVFTGSAITVDTRGPYSSVALLNNNAEIFYAMQTGIDGIAIISDPLVTQYIAANQGGTLGIKVKAHNFLPDSATVTLTMGITGRDRRVSLVSRVVKNSGNMLQVALTLEAPARISVNVFNARGALVKSMSKVVAAGSHSEYLPLGQLSNGIYCCKFVCGNRQQVTKFHITK